MGEKFSYINKEQRYKIKEMLDSGIKKPIIAQELGICRSSVYNELKRGTINGEYDPEYAHELHIKNNHKTKNLPILSTNRELANYISEKILEQHKSPEQIIKLLRRHKRFKGIITSTQTIYSAIDNGLIPNVTRESLISYQTHVFNDNNLIIPKWAREKLNISNGDIFNIEVDENKIIFTKVVE